MTLSSTTLALPKTISWPLKIGAFTQKERILSQAPIFWGKVHPPPWSPWSPPPPSTLTLAPGVHPPSTLESQSPSTLHPGALESTLHPGVHSISWIGPMSQTFTNSTKANRVGSFYPNVFLLRWWFQMGWKPPTGRDIGLYPTVSHMKGRFTL